MRSYATQVHPNYDRSRPIERPIRFIDLCAGLGGFHLGISLAVGLAQETGESAAARFDCVLAAEIDPELRELYVKNFPSITTSYARHYPTRRVEGVHGLSDLYADGQLVRVHGDIRDLLDDGDENRLLLWPDAEGPDDYIVPEHDLLCAGFPCQPFSKSGAQRGFDDLNGTVFKMLAVILKYRRPRYVLLENVGNFERHDGGNTWMRVKQVLEEDLGYDIRFTGHLGGEQSGIGLLSPHDHGMPHHRERFFVVGQLRDQPFEEGASPFPRSWRDFADQTAERRRRNEVATRSLREIVHRGGRTASKEAFQAAQLTDDKVTCIEHWGQLLTAIHDHNSTRHPGIRMPSFPIWGYELDPWNHYPIHENPARTTGNRQTLSAARHSLLREYIEANSVDPSAAPIGERAYLSTELLEDAGVDRWVASWPGYAGGRDAWPQWKQRFIRQNREWGLGLWKSLDPTWLRTWLEVLFTMRPSFQKLEWNCQGEELDIWKHVLQFRPSGLRVKRFRTIPALVAMTTTQVPIVPCLDGDDGSNGFRAGARSRHLLPSEALELQGFPPDWHAPRRREASFKAFGNAVHAGLVREIVLSWLLQPAPSVAVAEPDDHSGQAI